MGARIGYGAAWGALPLAGAVAAGAAGNTCLAIFLTVLVVGASLVIPLAPFLPLLNRLPLIGSPRLGVVMRLNGRRDLTLTTAAGEEHTCILDIEISNPSRWFPVKGAWINFLVPSGIKVGRCDQFGQPEDGGQWQDFQAHQLGGHSRADYWHDTDLDFPPRLTRLIRVKLRLGVGAKETTLEYPVLLKLAAPSLYRPIEQDATIVVRQGDAEPSEQMGRVITAAERALDALSPPFMIGNDAESERRRLTMEIVASSTELLTPTIENNPLPETPQDVDASTHFETVQMHLRALYAVREESGRQAD